MATNLILKRGGALNVDLGPFLEAPEIRQPQGLVDNVEGDPRLINARHRQTGAVHGNARAEGQARHAGAKKGLAPDAGPHRRAPRTPPVPAPAQFP